MRQAMVNGYSKGGSLVVDHRSWPQLILYMFSRILSIVYNTLIKRPMMLVSVAPYAGYYSTSQRRLMGSLSEPSEDNVEIVFRLVTGGIALSYGD